MRILHLLASADRRGAEVFGAEVAAALDRRGHPGRVVALSPGDGSLDVEVVPALSQPGAARRLRRAAADADVVLAHGSRGLVAGTLATLGRGVPLVYRSIGDPAYWGSTAARRARVGVQLRRAAAVTALWPGAAETIVARYRLDPDRVAVVPNAADQQRFTPADDARRRAARRSLGLDDRPVVAFVGALAPEKRVDLAIAAVAGLDDAVLVVAGAGPLAAEVAASAEDRLPGRHLLLGSVDDVAEVYAAADVVVLLSTTEGQPGVAIEAALSGLPVVATAVGGTASVVDDGRTGLLVPATPTAEEAADALRRALEGAEELGRRAREVAVERFSLAAVADRFEEVLATAAGADR